MEEWTKALDIGTPIDIIYTDFSKAFDKVLHNKLFFKLRSLGIKGNLLQWIKDFLTNRRQRVLVHNEFSNWEVSLAVFHRGKLFVSLPMAVGNDMTRIFADDKDGREVKGFLRTEPCGTPLVTPSQLENSLFRTRCLLLVRKSLIH